MSSFDSNTSIILLFALAAFVIYNAKRREKLTEVCPNCSYSRASLSPETPCPECGLLLAQANVRRSRRLLRHFYIILAFLACVWTWFTFEDPVQRLWWHWRYPLWELTSTITDGRWTFQRFQGGRPDNDHQRRLVVLLDNKTVLDVPDSSSTNELRRYELLSPRNSSLPLRLDVTGDDLPERFISEATTGGSVLYVFSESNPPGPVTALRSRSLLGHWPSALPDGKHGCIRTTDRTFSAWHGRPLFSDQPEVKLEWDGTRFAPSQRLTARPAPSETVEQLAAGVSKDLPPGSRWPSFRLPSLMLDLMYEGHEQLAWAVFAAASKGHESDAEVFRHELEELLAKSPYWPALKAAYDARPPAATDR